MDTLYITKGNTPNLNRELLVLLFHRKFLHKEVKKSLYVVKLPYPKFINSKYTP